MEEPTIEEVSLEQKRFLEERTREYKEQGADPLEAIHLAQNDWATAEEIRKKETDEVWDKFTNKIGLEKLLDDQMRRGLGTFKTAYEKAYPEKTIDFKLYYSSKKSEGGVIASVYLILEICRNGLWKVWRRKQINFQHIREMRDGYKWKLALQEAMYYDLMSFGITYCILLDEANEQPRKESRTN